MRKLIALSIVMFSTVCMGSLDASPYLIAATVSDASAPYVSKVWTGDQGDGTYRNPILYADYSDPDVIRVGDDYYMTASSFTCLPGLPILQSKDLVNWTLIGHAVQRYPNPTFDKPQHGKGIWAPSMRHYKGQFYIYWGDPDDGIYMVKAPRPEGPWSEPVLTLAGKGMIDTCPLWDDDGNAYLVHGWAGSRTGGFKSVISIRRMNAEGTVVSSECTHVFDGHERHPTIEGPKFYKREGFYYIFAPAGGVSTGWQTILRSRSIYGPYEDKIVMDQGSTPVNGPHQGGWVQASGEDWFIHFQDVGPYGRIIHLQPMQWKDGWPVIGVDADGDGKGEPVLKHKKPQVQGNYPVATPAESDTFDGGKLGLQWQWQANPRATWYVMLKDKNYLRLFVDKSGEEEVNLRDRANLLLQKFPAPDFTATTKATFTPEADGKRTGLVITGDDYAYVGLIQSREGLRLAQVTCKKANEGGKENIEQSIPLSSPTVHLRVKVSSPDAKCQFSYSLDGQQFTDIGQAFQAKPGGWIGAKVGLFCVSDPAVKNGGYADYDGFTIE